MKKIKILVVEDENIVAKDIQRILDTLGNFFTSIVSSGKEALKRVKRDYPDLILMDIVLQDDPNGIETARQIHSHFDIPIVFISGYTDEKTVEAAKYTEPFGYILKPIDPKELQTTIEIALYKHATEQKLKRAFHESQDRYHQLIENLNEGIIIEDENGIITYINLKFVEMQGYTREEVVGHPTSEFLDEESFNKYKKQIAQQKRGSRDKYEIVWKRTDGQKITTIMSPQPIYDEKGNFKGIIAVITDITERRLVEEELNKSREVLRKLSLHLQSIREKESKRIAREIHDELGQALTALKMDISWMSRKLPDNHEDQKKFLDKINSISKLIDTTIQTVQKISAELRPGLLDDLGLVPAIEWLTQDFQKRSGVKCKVDLNCNDLDLNPDCSTAVFRIVQEALTNVARHATASRVNVDLKENAGKLELKITDNGRGIKEEDISSPESLGLIGMRERLYPFGGELKLAGVPDKGTTLLITIPVKKATEK